MAPSLHGLLTAFVIAVLAAGVTWAFRHPARYRFPRVLLLAVAVLPAGYVGAAFLVDALVAAISPVATAGGLLIVLLVAAVFSGLVYVACAVPWRGPAWGLLAAPAALAAVILVVDLARDGAGASFAGAVVLAALPLAAFGPFAASAPARAPRDAAAATTTAAAIVIALGLVVVALAGGVAPSPPPHASHAWEVRVTPEDADAPYAVRVPFAFADGDVTGSVDVLRNRAHVTEGDAEIGWVEDGKYLEVQATGDVVVRADFAFYGTRGDVAGFPRGLAEDAVLLLSPVPMNATVDWRLTMQPEGRHTCGLDAALSTTVGPGGVASLTGDEPFPPLVCA